MSCYYPRYVTPVVDPSSGEVLTYQFHGDRFAHSDSIPPGSIQIPCKKCIGCRLDYSRNWADRLMVEYDHSKKAVFLTCTLSDDNLMRSSMGVPTVALKEQFSPFIKRLRSRKEFLDKEIRFFAASEYSPQLRPHYHAVVFGISLDDIPGAKFYRNSKHEKPIYRSDWLDSVWSLGYCFIGHVSWQSCAYVARYSLKKVGKDSLSEFGCEPERAVMSRRPGIGGYFLSDHPDFDPSCDKIYFPDPDGVSPHNSCSIPLYIKKQIVADNPTAFSGLNLKPMLIDNRFLAELSNCDYDEWCYNELKEKNFSEKLSSLKRSEML